MKQIKHQANDVNLDTLILENNNLVKHIKEKPDMLPSVINYLDTDQKNELLEHFCKSGDLKYVKCLVSNGADVHTSYEHPICVAIKNGHLDVVKYLVSKGVDIHAYCDFPLWKSVEEGQVEICKYLISQDASINKDNESMLLYTAVDKGHLEVVKCLVPKSAEIHKNTEFLEYYLKQAIESDHSEIAEYITSLM